MGHSSQSNIDFKFESENEKMTLNQTDGELKFKETLDKYYTDVTYSSESEEAALNEADTLKYFESKSSSYYKESLINFDKTIKKHNRTMQETISDIQKYYSDIKFSDGFNSGRGKWSFSDESGQNHKFDMYENYRSGYETTMDMPKSQVF